MRLTMTSIIMNIGVKRIGKMFGENIPAKTFLRVTFRGKALTRMYHRVTMSGPMSTFMAIATPAKLTLSISTYFLICKIIETRKTTGKKTWLGCVASHTMPFCFLFCLPL